MFSAEDSSCADINKTRVSGRSKRICSRNLRCSPGVTKWRRFEVACTGNRIWERRPGIHHPRRRRTGSYRFWGRAISSAPQAHCWEGRVHSGMDGERDSIVPRRHVGVCGEHRSFQVPLLCDRVHRPVCSFAFFSAVSITLASLSSGKSFGGRRNRVVP